MHPEKTRIVYCKDNNRRGDFPCTEFTFLGFTFRPRGAKDKHGVIFTAFLPAISKQALKRLSRTVRSWRLHKRTGNGAADLARMINPVVRGWVSYYGRFYHSALSQLLHRINTYLLRWIMQKYRVRWKQAVRRMVHAYDQQPAYFAHWNLATPAGARTRTTRAV